MADRIKRNQPCPCGRGHKYKKCCGRGPTKEQTKQFEKLREAFRP